MAVLGRAHGQGLTSANASPEIQTPPVSEKVMSEGTSSRVECEHALQYAVHDGISLAGDFYKPADATNLPVVVAVHGGAWKVGDATDFQYWGPWLASRGIAVYSIEYRLVRGEQNRYPAAVFDVRASGAVAPRSSPLANRRRTRDG